MTDKERKSCICTIKMLRNLAFNVHEVMDVINYENCEKMISLLESFEQTAQPPATDTNVGGNLIDRQAAINAICEDGTRIERQGRYSMTMVERKQRDVDILENLPSAQSDIIACGDCKHWICHDRRCGYWNHGVKPLDWCCHAERRSDG